MTLKIDPERLKEIRKRCGLTQDALAKKARLDKGTISRLEREKRPIRKVNLDRLAKALGVDSEVLTGEKPIPEEIRQPAMQEADIGYQLNVRVDGQIRNAFSLAALHYKVPVRKIVELAPLLFVLAAEGSLKRRREKLAELEARLERAADQWSQIPYLPSSPAEPDEQRQVIEAEKKSIAARDLFADFEFGHTLDRDDLYEHDSKKENPLAIYLRELAEGCGEVTIESLASGSLWEDTDYSVCQSEALDFAGGHPWLATALLSGFVAVHEVLRDLQVPEFLRGAQWTPEGTDLRVKRVRAMADRWKEQIDGVTFYEPREWMERIGMPQVLPKSHLVRLASGDDALAEKLSEVMRSGRTWWREMPDELWDEGAEVKRLEWFRRFVEKDASEASPVDKGQEKTA